MDQIVDRCQEVDTGARNIENILNRTMLPELASLCLVRIGDDKAINRVHISVSDEGTFEYEIN